MSSLKRVLGTALVLAAGLGLSACGFSNVDSLPLPGGAATGATYSVTVIFNDVADLGVKDGARVNDVPVGEISSITLTKDLQAKVVVKLRNSVVLPRNATATIEETSLLGENFVALASPVDEKPVGRLVNHDVISSGTSTDPDTEQVLGALSAVLNGGDVGRLQIIVQELDNALDGHAGDIRSLLGRLNVLVGTLNTNRKTIVDALNGLDNLSSALVKQNAKLGTIISELPQGISILSAERPKLTKLISSIAQLGDAATHVITASRANVVADLADLKPIVSKLAVYGGDIATSLEIATTYPFANDALAAFKGDYAGFFATLNLNADDLANLITPASSGAVRTPSSSASVASPPAPAFNLSTLLLGVLGQ